MRTLWRLLTVGKSVLADSAFLLAISGGSGSPPALPLGYATHSTAGAGHAEHLSPNSSQSDRSRSALVARRPIPFVGFEQAITLDWRLKNVQAGGCLNGEISVEGIGWHK
jgi:hypothetical protein